MPTRIFISYQRDSETEARELYEKLTAAGFDVWQDVHNIRHTARWSVEINQALHDCERIVLLLTPKSMASDEVFNEWFFFYNQRKPIHCLMVEPVTPFYQLVPFQYLVWTQSDKRDWARLAAELSAPFAWPSVALKEKVISSEFAPERTLPEALRALKDALLNEGSVIALKSDTLKAIREHKPVDETELRLARYATWCDTHHLDERFVRLTMWLDQGSTAQQRFVVHESRRRFTDLRDVLAEEKGHTVVLLGDPGAGKSTLLRRLEMDTAVAGLRDASRPLTFFASLAEYGLGVGAGEALPAPIKWLSDRWAAANPELPPLLTLLQERRMLLLLDSLNEMPHTDALDFRLRADKWRAFIYDYVRDLPGNRAVFACRTLDYGAVLSTDENPIPQIQLEPMTREQVREYLKQYAPAFEDSIWQSFERDERQFELFRIPFMLQMMIDLVKAHGRIPEGRAEAFNGFVHNLLVRDVQRRNRLLWNGVLLTQREAEKLEKGGPPPSPYQLPERGLLIRALTTLAYVMQLRTSGEEMGQVVVDYDDALDYLGQYVAEHAEQHETVLRAGCAVNVLDELNDRIRYYHQLLQEFFAARRLAAEPQPQLVRVEWRTGKVTPTLAETIAALGDSDPLPPLAQTGWEETTALAAVMSADPDAFVRGLLDANLPLAGRIAAAPDTRLKPALKAEIAQALIARTRDYSADVRARIAAGLALGTLGDPRFERRTGPFGDYLLPPLVPIAAGEYPIGDDDSDYDAEKPAHTVKLDTFQIGMFPVTNAEYALFIAAGGYDDERWWDTDAAKACRRGEGQTEGQKQARRDLYKTLQSWSDQDVRDFVPDRLTNDEADNYIWFKNMDSDELEEQLDEWYPAGTVYNRPQYWDDSTYNHPAQPVVGICWYEARAYCAWLTAQVGGDETLILNPSPSGRRTLKSEGEQGAEGRRTLNAEGEQGAEERRTSKRDDDTTDGSRNLLLGEEVARFRERAQEAMVHIARDLRQRQTPAEVILWECLRDRRLAGIKFRRQHPVANTAYVVDFFSYEHRLVVELDGPIHNQQQREDAYRQQEIQAQGLRVLRYTNEQVTDNLEQVLVDILEAMPPFAATPGRHTPDGESSTPHRLAPDDESSAPHRLAPDDESSAPHRLAPDDESSPPHRLAPDDESSAPHRLAPDDESSAPHPFSLREKGQGDEGFIFRLPTEAEFEAAARGKGARQFPYDGVFDSARCNTFESHIRRTTPIGVFENATPEGAYDLSGNAYTWTSSIYDQDKLSYSHAPANDPRREDVTRTDVRRVLRGGSWFYDRVGARAVYRFDFRPLDRSFDIGFRLVAAFVPS
ncbi:MAG: SUMF1/EgtB/PvdO family nonheme iron enzyme [Chloroflexota bacterium]|nr:SUMF1/EgtB/PvdO family nonheme iron enzyme [Chloroflexota bacterium]